MYSCKKAIQNNASYSVFLTSAQTCRRVRHNHLQRDQLKTEPSLMPSLTALRLLI